MRRLCTSCGTPLPGKGHGWPKRNGGIVCGRGEQLRTVRQPDGTRALLKVKTPACRP